LGAPPVWEEGEDRNREEPFGKGRPGGFCANAEREAMVGGGDKKDCNRESRPVGGPSRPYFYMGKLREKEAGEKGSFWTAREGGLW